MRRPMSYASRAACRASRAHLLEVAAPARAARMQKIIDQPTHAPSAADGLEAMAIRASAWAGEPFLHEDEAPSVVLAPGTARRQALDDAISQMDKGRDEPTAEWKIRFALMLGLERVLSEKPPH